MSICARWPLGARLARNIIDNSQIAVYHSSLNIRPVTPHERYTSPLLHLRFPRFASSTCRGPVGRHSTLALPNNGYRSQIVGYLRIEQQIAQTFSTTIPLSRRGRHRYENFKSRRPSLRFLSGRRAFSVYERRFESRQKSSKPNEDGREKDGIAKEDNSSRNTEASSRFPASIGGPLFNRLPSSLHSLHAPTKQELLAAATGFWSRLGIHFKWATIKSVRPFTFDEISAFFSWIVLGHVVWIIVGTTTFFSLAILLVNTVFAQETLAKWVGNYLTQSSGVKVVFESAIVPRWKDGVISFKRVFVSRRPGLGRSDVRKGSLTSAAAAAAAAAQQERIDELNGEDEDTNYTQYDVSIETVDVTLSFAKWFNGKGLLKDVEMKGVRGVVDRTSVKALDDSVDPKSYRHEHNTGDFELDSFKLEDLLVTVYQPDDFRPFSVSIYSCDLPQLRKQWLFYDFLSANMMSGSYDNSLFTIHPRQTHNYTGSQLSDQPGADGESTQWKKFSRLRIDGLNIDHLNRGTEGPFSWIHEGNVDIVADIMFPTEGDGALTKVMSDFYDRVEASVSPNGPQKAPTSIFDGDLESILHKLSSEDQEENKRNFLIMDVRVHLNDVRASVPLFTRDISYVNNALVRPIVAYLNAKKNFIPVHCRVVKSLADFDGSWSTWDSGMMDDLSREMYEAFARDVLENHQTRKRRFKKVGIWTLQLAAQALFIGLAGNIA